MAKKQPAYFFKQIAPFWFALLVVLCLGVSALMIRGFSVKFAGGGSNFPKAAEKVETQKQASSSATVTPKPSSAPVASTSANLNNNLATIPRSYGRMVNVPILYYHYIAQNPNPKTDKARDSLSVVPDLFDAQMGYLASNGFTPVSLDTMYAALKYGAPLPPKPIILTFDDGYIDFYVNAYPILRKYNFHATSFIPTGLMNQGYYLNWAQIKEMDASGLISFEAHSVHHPNLAALDEAQLRYEITESKRVLEAELGKPVNWFAYPYGASNFRTWQAVKEANFVGAVGTWSGMTESEGNLFDMPRIRMGGTITIAEFAAKI